MRLLPSTSTMKLFQLVLYGQIARRQKAPKLFWALFSRGPDLRTVTRPLSGPSRISKPLGIAPPDSAVFFSWSK